MSMVVLGTATPAFAATELGATETSSISTSLTAAIQAAHGDKAAIEAAIAKAVENAVTAYGGDAAGSIASAVLSIAETAGATGTEIGDALAQASASIAATDLAAAKAIATTVANEGKTDEIAAYQTSATQLGYQNLASLVERGPAPVGETGGGLSGTNTGNGFSGGAGGGGGGCLNPSCTTL